MKLTLFTLKIVSVLLAFSWVVSGLPIAEKATVHTASAASTEVTFPAKSDLSLTEYPILPKDGITASMNTYIKSNEMPSSVLPPITPVLPPTNTTIDTAIELQPDTPIEAYVPPSTYDHGYYSGGGSLYYKVTLTERQKMTFLMMMPPGINHHMFMESTAGFRDSGPYQQLSYVGGPGTYYLTITEGMTRGNLTQPINLRFMLIDKFDDYERFSDDTSATDAYYWGPSTHTIDNPFDEDWKMMNIHPDGKLTIKLDNPSTKGLYKAELYDQGHVLIGTVYQNSSKTFKVPMNGYFTRVYAPKGKYDPDVPYTFTVDFEPDPQPICDWDEDEPWNWVCTGP